MLTCRFSGFANLNEITTWQDRVVIPSQTVQQIDDFISLIVFSCHLIQRQQISHNENEVTVNECDESFYQMVKDH